MEKNGGATTPELRKELAAKAFARTGAYDAAIGAWFAETIGDRTPASARHRRDVGRCTPLRREPASMGRLLPHERHPLRRRHGDAGAGQGALYNNLNDADAAYELVAEFDPGATAAVAIIKHANPCGVAIAADAQRGLCESSRLRSGQRVWRRDRAQPQPRC